MIALDEDALICDLAETYNIYDYKQLPPTKVAVFSYGLKEESRIKMIINGQSVKTDQLLLAKISDSLSTLVWHNTKDGQKGVNPPQKMVELLLGKETTSRDDIVAYQTGEDFEKARKALIGGV